jgi:hypothetical protein
MRLAFPEFINVAGWLWSTVGLVMTGRGRQPAGRGRQPAGKSLPAPLSSREILHGPDRHGTQASAVEGRRLTRCAMARPLLQSLRYEILFKNVVRTDNICYRSHASVTQELPVIRDAHLCGRVAWTAVLETWRVRLDVWHGTGYLFCATALRRHTLCQLQIEPFVIFFKINIYMYASVAGTNTQ